eukprot:GHVT01046176.1.p2 GENE.GHVT01046176.1~~GHVT01046176.1.p2  ORF type:complete len:103 (-),score=6.98 GHVT01046176.1:62-370(-)
MITILLFRLSFCWAFVLFSLDSSFALFLNPAFLVLLRHLLSFLVIPFHLEHLHHLSFVGIHILCVSPAIFLFLFSSFFLLRLLFLFLVCFLRGSLPCLSVVR